MPCTCSFFSFSLSLFALAHLSLFFSLNLDKTFFFGNPVIGNLTMLHRKCFAVAVAVAVTAAAAAANVLSCRIFPFIILDGLAQNALYYFHFIQPPSTKN